VAVAESPWTLYGAFQVYAVAGRVDDLLVGYIEDADTNIDQDDFVVLVDPGDSTEEEVEGQLTSVGNGLWAVTLPYSYAQAGAYTVIVTVTGPGGSEQEEESEVVVGGIRAGEAATLTVAQFVVADPQAQASNYTATIHWGGRE
jgi:hypothetical protein